MANEDPEVAKFVRDTIRPLCEQSRALKAKIASARNRWFLGLNTQTGTGSTSISEGREDGVAPLTQQQATDAMGQLITFWTNLNDEIVEKACTRPLEAT